MSNDTTTAADQDVPPELRPRAAAICPEPCDGSAHAGAVCWVWTPFADVEGGRDRLGIPWDIRQAASLPMDRGEYLRKRRPENNRGIVTYQPPFLLALVYDLLAVEQPHLVPARAQLRAAVESHDLAAVDALMEPLDRAAATLIPHDADAWWNTLKPRLDAHVQRRTGHSTTLQDMPFAGVRSLDRALDLWVKAFTPARNHNGYMESEGVPWMDPKRDLDALLAARCGGRAPGQQARLDDGRDVTVLAARWEQTGPPAGYRVRQVHRPGTPLVLDAETVTPDQLTDTAA